MPLRKKTQGTKKKLVVTTPPPNKPRTKETSNTEKNARVVDSTRPSAFRTKRRRLVRGPPMIKSRIINEVKKA